MIKARHRDTDSTKLLMYVDPCHRIIHVQDRKFKIIRGARRVKVSSETRACCQVVCCRQPTSFKCGQVGHFADLQRLCGAWCHRLQESA